MRTYNIAICDDELIYREHMKKIINTYAEVHRLHFAVQVFENGNALLEQDSSVFDVIFLDIEMGILNGIDVAKEIKVKSPDVLVVFITNHEGYAIEAFQARAFHYIKKPMDLSSFTEVMALVFKSLEAHDEEQVFIVKRHQNMLKIPIREILYFEKQRNKIAVVTLTEVFEIYETMKGLLPELSSKAFVQCHQGYVVSLMKIDRIEKGEIVMANGSKIPISKANLKEVKERYMSYLCGGD